MDIVNRLKRYMEYVGLPSTQFADVAKVPRPTISQILNGRNRKISNELIAKLHEAFPNLNIMWLLFGDGDMELKSNNQFSEPKNAPNLFTEQKQPSAPQQDMRNSYANSAPHISLRTSNIEEFVDENINNMPKNSESATLGANLTQIATATQDSTKKIQTIMVFYTDSSFEIFTPAKS